MIEFYQKQLISLLSPWIVVVNRMKPKTRYRIISLCFFADLVLFCIVRYLLHKESYFYNTALGMIFLCVLAILSLDKTLVLKPWRKSMVISWYGMCLVFTISDVLVTKKVCGLGLILAIHFTAVFFVWQNHSRKDLLWKAFKDAVKWAFVINAVVCFLFRFYVNGGRYAGIFTNPNTFGLYLVIIFAVFMSDLDWNVDTGKRFVKCIPTYVSLALIVFYISASQARTAMMAACGILIMWLVLRGILSVRSKQVKKYLSAIGLLVCFSVALYPVFYLGAKKIPKLVNHPIVFQDDVLYLANGEKIKDVGDRVIAESDRIEHVDVTPKEEQLVDNSIWGRLVRSLDTKDTLNKISSGRITIYKAYVKRLNLWGHHRVTLFVNGRKVSHAHNNWLQFAYTYGWPSMIFYGLITILSLIRSVYFYMTNRRRNATYAFLVPAICVGFVIATVTECLFLPFEVFPAFAYWFVFGDLFEKKVEEKELVDEGQGEDPEPIDEGQGGAL